MTQPLAKQSAGDPIAEILDLPGPVPTVLAVGAFLKNTLCLTKDCAAIISHDVGNLESVAAVRDFQACAERLLILDV